MWSRQMVRPARGDGDGDGAGERTFAGDAGMPALPLPALEATLARWVASVAALGDAQLLREARDAARRFGAPDGDGPRLHRLLQRRAQRSRNWVEQWWLQGAYLSLREPLLPFYSMCGALPLDELGWTLGAGKDLYHAAKYLHSLVAFWVILRQERLIPTRSADGKTLFSMSQFHFLFNTNREPGESCDALMNYFKTEKEGECSSHVIIMSQGRIFKVNALAPDGFPKTLSEWLRVLTMIKAISSEMKGDNIGLLTCDKRNIWSKNRQHLMDLSSVNKKHLMDIESAMFVAALDDAEPSTETETIFLSMNGNYRNRWADKSISPVFFQNGAVGGLCDHTAFDGAISVTSLFFVFMALLQGNVEEIVAYTKETNQQEDPQELIFDLDSRMRSELLRAESELSAKTSLIALVHENFSVFGRKYIQAHRLHPDSFVQMALQLAYYRMHRRPAPTYETATTRAYFNGRTETLRSCTVEAMQWVKAMLDSQESVPKKKELLERAISRHDELMNEAKGNAGCDRHLFGLYCTALEEGIAIPEFYSHPAYIKSGGGGNFILSTSLLGYTPIGGGVSPMCLDGYGVFYNLTFDKLTFTISVFKASKETSASKFYENLHRSLVDMKWILEQPVSKM